MINLTQYTRNYSVEQQKRINVLLVQIKYLLEINHSIIQ